MTRLLLQKLSRQGLHSTALELAKLLMALDPTDPMGVFCWIDYLALRAHRFAFLQVCSRPSSLLHMFHLGQG